MAGRLLTDERWGLSARRWAVAAGLVLLVTDLLLITVLDNERRQALERGRDTAALAADVAVRRADGLLDAVDRSLAGVGEVIAMRGTRPHAGDLDLHRLLVRSHARAPGLDWLSVIGTDGRNLLSSLRFPAIPLDLSDRDYVQAQFHDWEQGLYIDMQRISRGLHQPVVPLSRRVTDDFGTVMAVVAGGLSPAHLQQMLADPAPPQGLSLSLYRRDGTALACVPARAECAPAPAAALARLDRAGGTAAEVDARLLGFGAGVAAVKASAHFPLVVIADFSEAVLLAPWREHLPIFAAIAIGGNLALAVIALYAFRQVWRRRQALARLAAANLDLENRVRERTRELQRLASTDMLTGVCNRRAFIEEGEHAFALARRHGRALALMMVDADHFKSINDRHGHAGGDAVLRALADAGAGVLRATDLLARFGGEEFAVLLPETDAAGAADVGDRLLAAFRACEVAHEGKVLRFTVSIGVAVLEPGDVNLEALLGRADGALYQAKKAGRDRLVLASGTPPAAP